MITRTRLPKRPALGLQLANNVQLTVLLLAVLDGVCAFTVQQRHNKFGIHPPVQPTRIESSSFHLHAKGQDTDEIDRERVPVPRRRRRRDRQPDYDDTQEEFYDQEDSSDQNDEFGSDRDYDDDEFEEDDEDEDWLDDEEIENELFENVVIPNPLLDSIDPDGAADRFPELARDPRFWFDMVLFLAFLNFLSAVGPRDPFPDLPWY